MTSRVRWIQPPDRWAPQSGQFSITCSTCRVGVMRGRGEAVASLLAGLLLRWGLPGRFRLEAGHSERVARFRLALQFGNPPSGQFTSPSLNCYPQIPR